MKSKAIINKTLVEHHIFPNKKGYKYLFGVMEYVLENGCRVLYGAYESVAAYYGIKVNSVEKCIASAIETSFDNIYIAEKYGSFTSARSGKITNKRFIKLLIEEIHNA